jgi:protocatechuate 3,4-dioxygenase beta subunit
MTVTRTAWVVAGAAIILAATGLGAQVAVNQTVEIRTVGGDVPPDIAAMMGGGRGLEPMGAGTGLVVGQVLDAGSGQPVAGALVTMSLPGVAPLRALADGQGRYAFRHLPPGRFSVSAEKPGFVDGAHGRVRPSGPTQPIELAAGEKIATANIPMWRYSAITGAVIDEYGEPVVGAAVQVLTRTIVAGMPKLGQGPVDQTDDRGIYRIGTLPPGDYVVVLPAGRSGPQVMLLDGALGAARAAGGGGAAFVAIESNVTSLMGGAPLVGPAGVAPDGSPLTFQTVFYPASQTAARAATVRLGSGEERSGVDFERRAVAASAVTGTVTGPDGPAPNQTLTLIPAGSEDLVSPVGTETARSDAQGGFTFASIAPGAYTLRVVQIPRVRLGGAGETAVSTSGRATFLMRTVRAEGSGGGPPLPDEPTLWAEVPVSVEGHSVHVPVSLGTGLRVTGQVAFVGGGEPPERERLPGIRLTLDPADGRTAGLAATLRGRIEATGQFRTMAVPPGKYFVRVDGVPQNWYFRGATLGGRDVTDEPLTIGAEDVNGVVLTFTDRQTELSGTVTDPGGAQDSGALVIVFPTDRSGWINYGARPRRLQSTRVDATGGFRLTGLPPGEYFVAAVRDESAGAWQSVEFLESVASEATRLRLGEGDTQSQSLRVIR